MDQGANICSIPPEIFNHILDYLDEGTRTTSALFGQPTLNVIAGTYKHPPLKSLSRTCSGFRQLLFHRVFQHTIQLITAEDRDLERQDGESGCPDWPSHKFGSFLDFIQERELSLVVRSFTIAIKAQPEFDEREYYHPGRFPQAAVYDDHWKHLLQEAIPMLRQIIIIAPPTVLGSLTSVSVKPQSLKSLHIPYQILSLIRDPVPRPKQPAKWQETENDGNRSVSVLELGPWTSILLNEGSFLRSYVHSRNWQDNMFMSDELVQASLGLKMFSQVRSFCYIGLWAPQKHLRHIVRFVGSLPKVEEVRFSLQTTAPILEDPHMHESVNQGRLAAEMQESYPEMMYMFNQAGEIADRLEIDTCFDKLFYMECLDSKDVIDFDTGEELGSGWHWLENISNTHVLVKQEEDWMDDQVYH